MNANQTYTDIKRLDTVRTFADNVLQRGRDRWSKEKTPLLVDGIDPLSGDPVEWRHKGNTFIIHNLASQQNLFRMLRGLTNLTGEERYEQAARDAFRYHFENLLSPCGKLHWGGHQFIDLHTLKPIGHFDANCHEFKRNLPFYELMWDVNASITARFIRALWAGHVIDWRVLEMNRHAAYKNSTPPTTSLWDQPFDDPKPYFNSSGLSFLNCGADLIYAGGMLYNLAQEQGALDWALRMANMYTKARHPITGMGAYQYTKPDRRQEPPTEGPLTGSLTYSNYGDRIENKFGHAGSSNPEDEFYNPIKDKLASDGMLVAREGWVWSTSSGFPWYTLVQLTLAETIGKKADVLAHDAATHLEAHARHAYDSQANHFRPMWADGTDVTGLKIPRTGYGIGKKGDVYTAFPATALHLVAYARAYRRTQNITLWKTARFIAQGLGLGDIGQSPGEGTTLCTTAPQPDPQLIFALLELYRAVPQSELLNTAREIANRMIHERFHHGFFMTSTKHRYVNFDTLEPLAILALDAVCQGRPDHVPSFVGGGGHIHGQFDGHGRAYDHQVIWSAMQDA